MVLVDSEQVRLRRMWVSFGDLRCKGPSNRISQCIVVLRVDCMLPVRLDISFVLIPDSLHDGFSGASAASRSLPAVWTMLGPFFMQWDAELVDLIPPALSEILQPRITV